jgi:hypothetical protein
VVHSYREPISRLISTYFQMGFVLNKDDILEKIVEWFWQLKSLDADWEYYSRNLGMDIFKYPFDHNKGYSYCETDRFILIHTKMNSLEKLNDLVPTLDPSLSSFKMVKYNERKDELYEYVKANLVLYPDLIDHIYSLESRYLNYYYTVAEIETMKLSWKMRFWQDYADRDGDIVEPPVCDSYKDPGDHIAYAFGAKILQALESESEAEPSDDHDPSVIQEPEVDGEPILIDTSIQPVLDSVEKVYDDSHSDDEADKEIFYYF